MKQNICAVGRKNGGPGVLPSGVEASFFLDFLDTFSSRKKYQIIFAPKESLGPQAKKNFFLLGE